MTLSKEPGYRRLVLLFLAVIITACAAAPQTRRPVAGTDGVLPRSDRQGLAVIEFANATSHEQAGRFDPWQYGIAAMLTTDLEQTSMFNIVDRARLKNILAEQHFQTSGLVDPATAVRIGRMAAVHYILTGAFVIVGQDLAITAQVFSVELGLQLGAVSSHGRIENFFAIEKDLFGKVTAALNIVLNEEKQARIMRAIETKSVEASLKNYSGEVALLEAEALKKRGMERETRVLLNHAKQNFREALKYDPTYERAKENLLRLIMAVPMTL